MTGKQRLAGRGINMEMLKERTLEILSSLKEVRIQNGWTIAELSKKSGVSVGVIAELEKKDSKNKKVPSLVNFIALARTLGLSKELVLSMFFGYSLSRIRPDYVQSEIINYLKTYGIHDQESIDFIMQTIEFTKNRVKNKKIK